MATTQLAETIKLVSEAEKIRLTLLDVLEELRSINEGLRWQQEWFKTQTQDVQQALADREKEAQDWQQSPAFEEEVKRRVTQEVTEAKMQLGRNLPTGWANTK